jgi:hypothetical protein
MKLHDRQNTQWNDKGITAPPGQKRGEQGEELTTPYTIF